MPNRTVFLQLTSLSASANVNQSQASISILEIDQALVVSSNVTSVSVYYEHGCAVSNSAAYCWGHNSLGQVGVGNAGTPVLHPTLVPGLSSGVSKIAVGGMQPISAASCAIVNNGVKCWGNNAGNGLLGRPDTSSPGDVSGLETGVTDISVGEKSACAIKSGSVFCWGANDRGQVGDGTQTLRATPVAVSGLPGTALSVSIKNLHTCAVTTSGVYCWGANNFGQLGNGTTADSSIPVSVSGLVAGSTSDRISTGLFSTCITQGGVAQCWGLNNYGQLGNGDQINQTTPVNVSGLSSGVTDIDLGGNSYSSLGFACAVKSSNLYCWGSNGNGQLGLGDNVSRLTPTKLIGPTNITKVSAGSSSACAIDNGQLKCWGDSNYGQVGDGSALTHVTPVDPIGAQQNVTQVSTRSNNTCVVVNGGVKCWGANNFGQLGNGTTNQTNASVQPTGLSSNIKKVVIGGDAWSYADHACALTDSGSVYCWGANHLGQVGNGLIQVSVNTPTLVIGLSNVLDIEASRNGTCAILADKTLSCWGENVTSPQVVAGLTQVTKVAMAVTHTCVIDAGAAKCKGTNFDGEVGDGTNTTANSFVSVSGLNAGVSDITVFSYDTQNARTCAIHNGLVKCWGYLYTNLPTQPVVLNASQIVLGHNTICALTDAGGAKCWGLYQGGGWGDIFNRANPTSVVGLASGILSLGSNGSGILHNCAITQANSLKCWGTGNLGLGQAVGSLTPVLLSFVY